MTATGKTKAAIAAIEAQQARRAGIAKARQDAADRLVELQGERSHLEAEGRRVAAQTGPARFLTAQLRTDAETVIRWLVALVVASVIERFRAVAEGLRRARAGEEVPPQEESPVLG